MWSSSSAITRSFFRAFQARQRARERKRYGTERNPEGCSNLAVAQALGAQGKTAAVLFRQGAQHGAQALQSLVGSHLFFRVGSGVELGLNHRRIVVHCGLNSLVGSALLQGEIVGYAKNPSAQITARLTALQVAEQS